MWDDMKQEPLRFLQRRQKFREREEREGRRTAFQSGYKEFRAMHDQRLAAGPRQGHSP